MGIGKSGASGSKADAYGAHGGKSDACAGQCGSCGSKADPHGHTYNGKGGVFGSKAGLHGDAYVGKARAYSSKSDPNGDAYSSKGGGCGIKTNLCAGGKSEPCCFKGKGDSQCIHAYVREANGSKANVGKSDSFSSFWGGGAASVHEPRRGSN